MSVTLGIVGLWLLFAATHMGMSSQSLRPRLVAALGPVGFAVAYSVIALAVFSTLCSLYFGNRHDGALLWAPLVTGRAGIWTIYALQAVAWTLVIASFASPSPATVGLPAELRPKEPRGVHWITRHPLFMGVGLFGALHLLVMGSASDVAFWAGLPLFAALGCAHQDRRKRASEPDFRAWHDATPFLPFTGASTLRGLREIPAWVYAAGVGTTVALRWLHGPLFH